MALENGSFDRYSQSGAIDDRSKISYYTPGGQFAIRVGAEPSGEFHPLLSGNKLASYEVDFYPILNDAGLLGVSYFSWMDDDINPSVREKVKLAAASDRNDSRLLGLLPDIHFLQSSIINSLYIDAAMAHALHLPFGVDAHVETVIDWKRIQVKEKFGGELPDIFFHLWVSLGFPDYSNEPWEHVHDLRESAMGREFRRMIQRVSSAVRRALPDLDDKRAVDEIINREFVQELVRELFARRANIGKATWNVAANLIPYGSLFSTINDFRELVKEENSWVCLLGSEEF